MLEALSIGVDDANVLYRVRSLCTEVHECVTEGCAAAIKCFDSSQIWLNYERALGNVCFVFSESVFCVHLNQLLTMSPNEGRQKGTMGKTRGTRSRVVLLGRTYHGMLLPLRGILAFELLPSQFIRLHFA